MTDPAEPPEVGMVLVDVSDLADHIDAGFEELRAVIAELCMDMRQLRREVRNR